MLWNYALLTYTHTHTHTAAVNACIRAVVVRRFSALGSHSEKVQIGSAGRRFREVRLGHNRFGKCEVHDCRQKHGRRYIPKSCVRIRGKMFAPHCRFLYVHRRRCNTRLTVRFIRTDTIGLTERKRCASATAHARWYSDLNCKTMGKPASRPTTSLRSMRSLTVRWDLSESAGQWVCDSEQQYVQSAEHVRIGENGYRLPLSLSKPEPIIPVSKQQAAKTNTRTRLISAARNQQLITFGQTLVSFRPFSHTHTHFCHIYK